MEITLSFMETTSDIPLLPMGLQAILILLLPGQDSDMPLLPKKPPKLPVKPKKASCYFQIETVPMGVSNLPKPPKAMMSDTLFLPKVGSDMIFLFKINRNIPLELEKDAGLCFLSNRASYIHLFQEGVPLHSLLSKEISDIP